MTRSYWLCGVPPLITIMSNCWRLWSSAFAIGFVCLLSTLIDTVCIGTLYDDWQFVCQCEGSNKEQSMNPGIKQVNHLAPSLQWRLWESHVLKRHYCGLPWVDAGRHVDCERTMSCMAANGLPPQLSVAIEWASSGQRSWPYISLTLTKGRRAAYMCMYTYVYVCTQHEIKVTMSILHQLGSD